MKSPAAVGRSCRLLAALFPLYLCSTLDAADLNSVNASLRGHVVDFTLNRDGDRRFWSESLSLPRDMLVYLPQNYDPNQAYPLFLWVHGFGGDEEQFTRQVVRELDSSITAGAMPPVVGVCPDCS